MNPNFDHAGFNRLINWQPNIYKMGRGWWFDDVDGNCWPVPHKTKKAAYEMAMRHKDAVMMRPEFQTGAPS